FWYFVEFGHLHYTLKKGVIAFLFEKSDEFLENIRFLIKNGVSDLTLPYSVGRLLNENPDALVYALTEIGKDVKKLIHAVIEEGGADGIFFSTKNILAEGVSKEQFRTYVTPIEHDMLQEANKLSEYNILHICGFERFKNDLTAYADYPVKAINWPVVVDGVSLQEGKKLFGGKAVIGGFDNDASGTLYSGTEEEIKAETERILKAVGDTTGIILGADCTVPGDISPDHVRWVREAAADFAAKVAEGIKYIRH
ncbi:MAG: hypothetical protein IJZ34_05350, partial [Lachnospiraceae bacterium]|nr:hypothetical protein [Lachnospiraceae bacterium]